MGILAGSLRQKTLFLAVLAIYCIALVISAQDKMERIGQPDLGFVTDGLGAVSPSRLDASEMGLRGGGQALKLNGVEVDPERFARQLGTLASWELGASNTLVFQRRGQIYELQIPVRPWTWEDAAFTHGLIDILALVFVSTALVSFALRPYEATSWSILALATVLGGMLTVALIPDIRVHPLREAYLLAVLGIMPATILHAALAFPVVHPLLLRRAVPYALYALGALHAGVQLLGLRHPWEGAFRELGVVSSSLILATLLFFVARCSALSIRTRDPLIAQRARILLAAGVVGAGPASLAWLLRTTTGWFAIDMRMAYWAMAFFFLPLGYVSVRQSLVNAAATVRRAVAYAAVAGGLTGLGLLLMTVQAYALALLLFPLLYWWPSFERRLTARIYPKRARYPALLQDCGSRLATQSSVEGLLEQLADAPARLCDAATTAAFLLPGVAGPAERLRTAGGLPFHPEPPLASETLIKLVETTRKEIFRDQIAVQPQYTNIEADCYAGFDRLDAELILPILGDGRVLGGLAVGGRTTGDPYEPPEIFALTSVIQQFVQSLSRVEALQRLQAREGEFQELKRFFPPQIIDEIMEKGGAAKLRSGRKLVTVFFADLRGFTSFSEEVEPEEVMATLAEYHEVMGRRIAEHAGTLERFAGDGFMVFFNDPVDQPDHVVRAGRMALDMRADVQRLRSAWERKGYAIDIGMGIHTGYATVGFIGYEGRRDYAVIGNVTNLAARLSDAASGGDVLVSASVRAELKNGLLTEPAGTLTLKGISRPQPVFRLLPES